MSNISRIQISIESPEALLDCPKFSNKTTELIFTSLLNKFKLCPDNDRSFGYSNYNIVHSLHSASLTSKSILCIF